MKVLTEAQLREAVKAGTVGTFRVEPGTILTPSARAFAAERRIQLVVGDEAGGGGGAGRPAGGAGATAGPRAAAAATAGAPAGAGGEAPVEREGAPRLVCLPCGGALSEKPEFMTHLRGNRLVPKTHPRIRLRGQLDFAEGVIIQAQVVAQRSGLPELARHLGELLDCTRRVLRAEVLDAAVPEMNIMGMSAAEIRAVSHDPASSLGIKHILPSHEMGEAMSWLNLVRTSIRQTELAAVEAFWRDEYSEPSRQDIIQALNRLSSAAYVMMCRLAAGKYSAAAAK